MDTNGNGALLIAKDGGNQIQKKLGGEVGKDIGREAIVGCVGCEARPVVKNKVLYDR